jgi:hypothetical protein
MDEHHGWTNSSLTPYRIWNNRRPTDTDYATDQVFESMSWPLRRDEGIQLRDEQVTMPQSIIGDIYDVIVTCDRGLEAGALDGYRVIWLVGDTRLNPKWVERLRKFVQDGGTLVANVEQARGVLPEDLLGAKLSGQWVAATRTKCAADDEMLASSEFDYEKVVPSTAKALAMTESGDPLITQNPVGNAGGQVILTTPRWMMTRDGWALPLQPHLLLHVASGLLPVRVSGNVEFCVNRTAKGWLVGLMNNRGVYKHPHGQAIVDHTEDAPVEVYYNGKLHTHTTVAAGDVQLVEIAQ